MYLPSANRKVVVRHQVSAYYVLVRSRAICIYFDRVQRGCIMIMIRLTPMHWPMWSAPLLEPLDRILSSHDFDGIPFIHAFMPKFSLIVVTLTIFIIIIIIYAYDLPLIFIYLPNYCNLTMIHLVLRYRIPYWARGWGSPRGSASGGYLRVECRRRSVTSSGPAHESHTCRPFFNIFYFDL